MQIHRLTGHARRDLQAELTLATYNVESMFGPQPEPGHSEVDQPPKSPAALRALARVIRATGADVVALQEVHDDKVLDAFLKEYMGNAYPYHVVATSHDRRGINTAIISKIPLEDVKSHPSPRPGGRDVLEATVRPRSDFALTMLVAHLKAHVQQNRPTREDEDRRNAVRLAEAQQIRNLILSETSHFPSKKYVVAGDLNDTASTPAVQAIVGSGTEQLLDPLADSNQWSDPSHRRRIDYLLISPGLASHYVAGSAQVVQGSEAAKASDHRPVVARFRIPSSRDARGTGP